MKIYEAVCTLLNLEFNGFNCYWKDYLEIFKCHEELHFDSLKYTVRQMGQAVCLGKGVRWVPVLPSVVASPDRYFTNDKSLFNVNL